MIAAQDPGDERVVTPPPKRNPLVDLLVRECGDLDAAWPSGTEQALPKLAENQTRDITAVLLDPIITFSRNEELIRAESSILPSYVYRTYYETSNTLCCYVSKDTHPKHREQPDLKIADENGFQSIGTFNLASDVTRPRIERHLVWNKKVQALSFISAFDDITHAERRANFHYEDSQRIGMRVSVAQISTRGLIPATIRAQQQTKIEVVTNLGPLLGKSIKIAYKIHTIQIPVWIREHPIHKDDSSITAEQWHASGADLWDTIATNGHDYEWLADGFIPKAYITKVMPWDGRKLRINPHDRIVRSIFSADPWIFDWTSSMWRLDARLYRTGCFLAKYGGSKRKRGAGEKNEPEEVVASKRRKVSKALITKRQSRPKPKRNTNPYEQTSTAEAVKCMNESTISCTQCGTKKSPYHLEDEIKGPLSYLDLAVSMSGISNTI